MQEIDKDEGNDEENFAVITAENLKQEAVKCGWTACQTDLRHRLSNARRAFTRLRRATRRNKNITVATVCHQMSMLEIVFWVQVVSLSVPHQSLKRHWTPTADRGRAVLTMAALAKSFFRHLGLRVNLSSAVWKRLQCLVFQSQTNQASARLEPHGRLTITTMAPLRTGKTVHACAQSCDS